MAADTTPEGVAALVERLRSFANHEEGFMRRPFAAIGLRHTADVLTALAADLARVTAERDAAVTRLAAAEDALAAAEIERLDELEDYVREQGMNVDDDTVDSCASSSVYRAMLDLAEAGRMTIEPGGVGRRIFGRWTAAPAPRDGEASR